MTVNQNWDFVDGCRVLCTMIDTGTPHILAYLQVMNEDPRAREIDFSKMRVRFNDWFYTLPCQIYLSSKCSAQISVIAQAVDNLTYVEEVAKEKHLA